MLFHPAQLGLAHLDKATLEADKKACKKIGPCGVGKSGPRRQLRHRPPV